VALGTCAATQSPAPPLPEAAAFLREARENLARSQQMSHLYAYKERRRNMHFNPFGRIGTQGTSVFQVYPSSIPQLTYRRLYERDGTPVPESELRRQDYEYRLRVADVRRRLEREDADDRKRRESDELLARTRAQRMIQDVVSMLEFKMVRREPRAGRSAVVVTFTPKANARPVTREARIARSFTGSVWIDEAAREVLHVEATAIADIAFGGFIAKLQEGTKAMVNRREIEPGVWMPTDVTFKGQGRALLFRKLSIDYLVEWFDYQLMSTADSRVNPKP
jgi:hypothetical protein